MTIRISARACMGILAIYWLLGGCSPSIETPLPVNPTPVKPAPTPTYCIGMNYAIKGAVYAGSVDSANALSGVPVSFSQHSNCSPTAGEQTAYTAEDGSFEFNVYIHDTDSFNFLVKMDGFETASARTGGFDYLAKSRSPVVLVLRPSEASTGLAQSWQENINRLSALLNAQKVPPHLLEEKPILQGGEFDVMSVFEILDHIHMAEGYRLAYIYHKDNLGGFPRLYVHTTAKKPYTTTAEYYAGQPECSSMKNAPTNCDPMQSIETDGSELGYLQWLLLKETGGQFYLNWHANNKDMTFIATDAALDRLVADLEQTKFGYPISAEQAEKAQGLDPSPEVSKDETTVFVRVVWFSKWGGFFETRYRISRDFPHSILETTRSTLLEYNCGVVF